MFRTTLHSLWQRRRRLFGTVTAIVLGVAFLVGTLVLGDTFSANFDRLFTETAAGTDVVVRNATSVSDEPDAQRGPIDATVLDRVRSVDGVAVAESQVTGYGQLIGTDGEPIGGNGPPRIAGSWIETPDLNPYELAEGRPPRADDEVVVNRGAAEAGGLSIGDRAVVQTPSPVEVTIVGIATFGGEDGFGQTTFTGFTLDGAQRHVTGQPDRITDVLVQAADGVGAGELRQRIDRVLGDGTEAITGNDLVDERLESLGFLTMIRSVLVGFALVAMFVATVSINNTFTITVAQRTRELAMLRTVGASRRQVRSMVRVEAAAVGVVGAVLGAVIGVGVAIGLKGVFDAFGSGLPAGGLTVRPAAIVIGLAVGIALTLLAARSPARRASRVAPIEALRDASTERTTISRRRLVTGVLLGVGGAALTVAGTSGTTVVTAAGAIGVVAAALVLAPAALPAASGIIGAIASPRRGVNAALAIENTRREPRRSASAATALLIGVAVVTVFTVFATSASSAIDDRVSDGFGHADLAISTPVFGGGTLSTDIVGDLRDLDAVDRAIGVGAAPMRIDDRTELVTATALHGLGDVLAADVIDGSLPDAGGDSDVVPLVVEESAADGNLRVGSSVPVTFADGIAETARVEAIVSDHELLQGFVVPVTTWAEHEAQPAFVSVFITLTDGVGPAEGRRAISDLADRYTGDIQDRAEFADARTQGLDMLLNVVYVMLALAIIIALLGIANTLSLAVHERRREIGLLRAVGQTQRQVRRVLRIESIIVSTFGTLLGVLIGAFCGALLFETVFDAGRLTLPAGQLAVTVVLGVVAGALAATRPARRAARLPVLEAIGDPG